MLPSLPPSPAKDRRRRRGLFPHAYGYALLLFALSIPAFWPVYFSVLSEVRWTLHLHSVTAMLWVALLIGQSWLARQKRFAVHRWAGRFSYGLAPLFVGFSILLFHDFLNSGTPFSAQFGSRITFYDLAGIAYFSGAYLLAVTVYRRKAQLHARLMISTIILMLFPVIGRLLLFYVDLGLTPAQSLALTPYLVDVVVLGMLVLEWRRGRVYPVFPILLAVTLVQHLGFVYADGWAWWQAFVAWFAGL